MYRQWRVYEYGDLSGDQRSLSRCRSHVPDGATGQYWHTNNCRQMQADCVTNAHKAAQLPGDNNRNTELCYSLWHKTTACNRWNISKEGNVFSVLSCLQPQECVAIFTQTLPLNKTLPSHKSDMVLPHLSRKRQWLRNKPYVAQQGEQCFYSNRTIPVTKPKRDEGVIF